MKKLTLLRLLFPAMLFLALACAPAPTPTPTPQPTPTPVPVATATPTPRPVATPTPTPAPVATPTPAPTQFLLKATDHDKAKRVGILRLGAHGPPAHFDFYASATIANIGSQGAMYDGLMRRDPRTSEVPVIPDLAYEWKISPDGKSYTFFLRKSVRFHDGAELTSDDVKATYERIIFPKTGLLSLRQAFFTAVSKINTPDKYTVEFVLAEPREADTMLKNIASEWNMIVRKETLDKPEGLRTVDNFPGTGPFKYVKRDVDKWVLERNPNYWNPNVPYVDGLEHIWLKAWTPENTAALLGGKTDWTMWLAPKDGLTIGQRTGLNGARMNSFTMAPYAFNNERKPYDDARVRRAFWLAIDEPALLEATREVQGLTFGEFFVKGTPYVLSTERLQQIPGFRSPTKEDIAEAKRLLAEAGYPDGKGFRTLDLLTRETIDQRTWSAAIQAMLKENLNVSVDIRIADISVWQEESFKGNYDMTVSVSKSLAGDPADYVRNQFGVCADRLCAENVSRWRNDEFNRLIRTFELEVSLDKKKVIANQIRDLLIKEVPAISFVNSEIVYWGWWDHLKGLEALKGKDFFTWYEFHKWDFVWLSR